ncbi:response regulator [Phenylobacterium montanum]|uniref:Response regulator n=1 Tax=Phenylobacterium montanum TaxID=2823693 RepID=A0A975G1W8_9CAUL|nr:response regulator [Caulobacter sp. S6]QUD89608.1 response regulator [Caulobacter sp. S6]
MAPPLRALVVDDNDGYRQLFSTVIRSLGHVAEVATDGDEAVEQALAGQFDLILMDLSMPRMDGLTATRLIRRHERCGDGLPCSIAMVTSHGSAADVRRSKDAGACQHLVKPIGLADLVALVEACRSSRQTSAPVRCGAENTHPAFG